MPDELWRLSAAEAGRRLAARKLKAEAYLESFLARIQKHDKKLNTIITLLADQARAAARKADREIRAGRRRGPLHGIPVGVKDIINTKGIRTTAHSRLLEDNVPDHDATVVKKLNEAGAVIVAKLSTHEFAVGGATFKTPFPPARNPWNTDHDPSGSSSGSGAGVAAGLFPLALGSDTGGSIRGPAAHNGIAGLKPTYGLVSRAGVIPLAFTLDHIGPMAWTVEDAALLLQVLAGPDAADPASADRPVPDFSKNLKAGVKGLRIGVIRHFYERDAEVAPVVRDRIEAALKVLKRLGAKVKNVKLPKLPDWEACGRVIIRSESYAVHEHDLRTRPQLYAPITCLRLSGGASLLASDYIQALRMRRELSARYLALFDEVDVVVTAVTMEPSPKLVETKLTGPLPRSLTIPFNLLGAPSLAMCCGFSKDGLPVGFQIAGKPFDDATVLRVGHAYEQATPWREKRPID
jgi:aspartyl-tRNA(Asn)/glutamyl-tRNA(Gln) amidotransferase subunit A